MTISEILVRSSQVARIALGIGLAMLVDARTDKIAAAVQRARQVGDVESR